MRRFETSVVAMVDGDAIVPIPPELVEEAGLNIGDHYDVTLEGGSLVFKPILQTPKPSPRCS